MTKKRKSTEPHGNEVFENPEALVEQFSRTEHFIEKNKTLMTVVISLVTLALVGFLFSRYYVNNQNENAQRDLFQAVYYFESDSLGKALNGDGNNYGFLEIIDEYGMTKAANLSNFYAGATYLKLGDFENALRYLGDFSASDYLIQARAYALMGDAYMDLQDFDAAASSYEKAADYNANKQFSPTYLIKAAIANERRENLAAAIQNYQVIIDEYFGTIEYQDALKHKARLEGLLK